MNDDCDHYPSVGACPAWGRVLGASIQPRWLSVNPRHAALKWPSEDPNKSSQALESEQGCLSGQEETARGLKPQPQRSARLREGGDVQRARKEVTGEV